MTSRAIHPGEHLAEELDALDMSAAELARRLKVPTNRVTAILNGQRAISGDTALRLAHFFGTSPQFWLNLQSLYEIRLAEEKSGKAIRKLPSGVAASEIPWHESSVSEVAKGDPATRVSTPVAGLIWNEVMVRSPVLATNRRLLIGLSVIRLSP